MLALHGALLALLCGGLLLLSVLAVARRRKRRRAAGAGRASTVAASGGERARSPHEPDTAKRDTCRAAQMRHDWREPQPQPEARAAHAPAPVVAGSAAETALALQDAVKSNAHQKLPALYLELGRCRLAEGEQEEAAELLRKSILAASGSLHRQAHAEARVLLGDIALMHGDPTTACEHWQIARRLFHELEQAREHTDVEARMLKNGCPTDWVLTDF
jgi:tetratricopeptide (TPR) repeat protein